MTRFDQEVSRGSAGPDAVAAALRRRALRTLKRRVPFDAVIWGTGKAQSDGTMLIDKASIHSTFGPLFIDLYNTETRKIDVIGKLFVAFPNVTQVIPLEEFRKCASPQSGGQMWQYLTESGRHIAHLMLSGLRSSYGYAWITLYRQRDGTDRPFTKRETEFASRFIPFHLYRWQELRGRETPPGPHQDDDFPSSVLPLTPQELFVAIKLVQDFSPKQIAFEVNTTDDAVRKMRRELRKKLALDPGTGLLSRLLGETRD